MKSLLTRFAGFIGFPLLALAIPLVLLPVIARITDDSGWSSTLAGQAIGIFAGTVVLWGWNVDGPVRIARASGDEIRAAIYSASLRTRILLFLLAVPFITALVAVVSSPGAFADAISMALASALAGLSPSWFCIGLGKPRLLAIYDTVPRVLATIAAAPLLLLTRQVWIYPVLLLIFVAIALVAFHRHIGATGPWFPRPGSGTLGELRGQLSTAGINLAANAYGSSPVPIASGTRVSDVAAASFGSGDQLFRYGTFAIAAMGNTFQSWTIEPGIPNRRQRQTVAIAAHGALGLAGAGILALLGPWASSLIFGLDKQAAQSVCAIYGVAYIFLSVSTPLIRNLLIPAGRQKLVLGATIATASLGMAAMVAAGALGSADGIAWGMAFGEAAMFFFLLPAGLREYASVHSSGPRDSFPSDASVA
jgi:PST family polysaccharide transporter